jgi:hypothetical protein
MAESIACFFLRSEPGPVIGPDTERVEAGRRCAAVRTRRPNKWSLESSYLRLIERYGVHPATNDGGTASFATMHN